MKGNPSRRREVRADWSRSPGRSRPGKSARWASSRNDPEAVGQLIGKLGPPARWRACSEAGPCGDARSWPLTPLGVAALDGAPTLGSGKAGARLPTDRREAATRDRVPCCAPAAATSAPSSLPSPGRPSPDSRTAAAASSGGARPSRRSSWRSAARCPASAGPSGSRSSANRGRPPRSSDTAGAPGIGSRRGRGRGSTRKGEPSSVLCDRPQA